MRKIIAAPFVALDGVVQMDEPWTMPYFSTDLQQVVRSGMDQADTLLMGRRTYEEMAAFWPDLTTEDDPFADYLNKVPKLVVSTTLTSVGWTNTTLVSADVLPEIATLKAQSGTNIMIPGSATLVRSLLHAGLVDQLRLLLFPVVLGGGGRLFEGLGHKLPLRLTESRTFEGGVVSLVYELAPPSTDAGDDLPDDLPGPARRALTNAGYARLDQLTAVSERELLGLHGIGPAAVARLRRALAAAGKSFAR